MMFGSASGHPALVAEWPDARPAYRARTGSSVTRSFRMSVHTVR